MHATWETTKPFVPLLDTAKEIKVLKVYDGDTITVAAKPYAEQEICRFVLRLDGLDTPELKIQREKDAGLFVRDELAKLLLNKFIKIKVNGADKYGRLLSDIWVDDIHVNEWLLKNKYAKPYDGGTKVEMSDDFLQDIVKII